MSRRFKLKNIEAHYHITVRTAQKKWWLTHEVKEAWEAKLAQLSQAFYVDVLAHVAMTNHVHLVVKVASPEKDLEDLKKRFEFLESTLVSRRIWHDEWEDKVYDRFTDLSAFMRDLNQWIARWHNQIGFDGEPSSGHLWGRRFFSKLVGDDQHLLTAMSYVDLNPVKAGMVERARDYKYSTAGKLNTAIEQGETPPFPAVGFLRHVKKKDRARAYLTWLDFLTIADKNKDYPATLTGFGWAIEKEKIDVAEIRLQIKNGEPSDWSKPIFANDNFVKAIQRREGWLPGSVHNGPKELADSRLM